MSFPFALGGGLGSSGVSLASMRRLLKRLLPSGYAESGALLEELECWGAMLLDAHTLPQRIANESFVALAFELLEEWEREYRLPNDAARTTEQRQARLVAAERAVGGSIRSRVEAALREVSPSAEWLTNEQAFIAADALGFQGEIVFQHVVQLTEAEWAKPAVRRGVARVVQRMSAARAQFADGYVDPTEIVVANVDSTWGSADHVIGRDAIRQTDVGVYNITYNTRARVRQYGPLSKIRARDLNALQDAVVYAAITDGVELSTLDRAHAGRIALNAATSCAGSSTTTVLDAGADWRHRLVTVWASVASDDIRPGQASDAFVGTSTLFRAVWYSGFGATDGGASASSYAALLATGVYLYADSTTGALKIRNTTAGTRYVVSMMHASGECYGATGRDRTRTTTFVDGVDFDSAGLDAAFYATWRDAALTRAPGGTNGSDVWSNYAGAGGEYLVAVVPSIAPGDIVIVDALRDWRDRLLAVTCVSIQLRRWDATPPDDPAWPGSSRFDQLQCHPSQTSELTDQQHTTFAYTRLGNANGNAIAGTMCPIETSARVWVDSTTGYLRLTRDAGDTQTQLETYVLLVHASEQTGVRSDPDALNAFAPGDGDDVHPAELNQVQDRSLVTQAGGDKDSALTATRNLPLGDKSDPITPWMPELWPARETNVADSLQPVAGWARALFSGVVPAGASLVLDTTRDWRDRFAWAQVAWDGTNLDRYIGAANEGGINASSAVVRHNVARYLGDGAPTIWADAGDNHLGWAVTGSGYALRMTSTDDDDCIFVGARESDGALMLTSTFATDVAMTAAIEATFQLGLRRSS